MVEWHHQLNGHEFEQALGVGEGQGNLVCCSPWGCKESDTTEQLNWTELIWKCTWTNLDESLKCYVIDWKEPDTQEGKHTEKFSYYGTQE